MCCLNLLYSHWMGMGLTSPDQDINLPTQGVFEPMKGPSFLVHQDQIGVGEAS